MEINKKKMAYEGADLNVAERGDLAVVPPALVLEPVKEVRVLVEAELFQRGHGRHVPRNQFLHLARLIC
jgi:hypothetical protein